MGLKEEIKSLVQHFSQQIFLLLTQEVKLPPAPLEGKCAANITGWRMKAEGAKCFGYFGIAYVVPGGMQMEVILQ